MQGKPNAYLHYCVGNHTDELAPMDAGLVANLKYEVGENLDEFWWEDNNL